MMMKGVMDECVSFNFFICKRLCLCCLAREKDRQTHTHTHTYRERERKSTFSVQTMVIT